MIEPKPEFLKRMKELLKDENDFQNYLSIIKKPTRNIIRVNTIKISEQELIKKIEKKWKIDKIFENALEIKSDLLPGALGKAVEHQLGLYYIQELSSMLPPLALEPREGEAILDLCAAPGSKTTQISMLMQNKGTIIANDIRIDRLKALQTNLDRCGCTNVITTKMNGINLCSNLEKKNILFDKILLDAPCSGEGIVRSDPNVLLMWNLNMIKKIASEQRKLISAALSCLKRGGILVYSTCTHAPEENEFIIEYALKNFNIELQEIKLPIKSRDGIVSWEGEKLNSEIKFCRRIYPQDNDSEGFFIAKLIKK